MISVKNLTSIDEFHEFINDKEGELKICRLAAPWCGPCRVLGETIRNLNPDLTNGAVFAEIDIDTDETEAVGAECGVRGVPVLLFYRNGEELKRTTGAIPASEIYKIIKELSC